MMAALEVNWFFDAVQRATEQAAISSFHLARYAIEELVGSQLQLPLDRTNWETGRRVGHVGPCDHLISIDRLLRAGELGEGDQAPLVSWGGGWNTTATVIKILHVPDWAQGE